MSDKINVPQVVAFINEVMQMQEPPPKRLGKGKKAAALRARDREHYAQRLRDKRAIYFELKHPSTVKEAWRMNTLVDLQHDDNLATPLLDGAL